MKLDKLNQLKTQLETQVQEELKALVVANGHTFQEDNGTWHQIRFRGGSLYITTLKCAPKDYNWQRKPTIVPEVEIEVAVEEVGQEEQLIVVGG